MCEWNQHGCKEKGIDMDVKRRTINLFLNSDAILNRDALWSIQGKKHYLQAAIVGGNTPYRKNSAVNICLVTMGIFQSIF